MQYATLQETLFPGNGSGITANAYLLRTFSLWQFPRALAIAQNYKFYRAVEVQYKYTPNWINFQEDLANLNPTLPQMFTVMNRTQDLFVPATQSTQVQYMVSQGATPRAFKGDIVLKYKPNWTTSGLVAFTQGASGVAQTQTIGAKASYGWLPSPTNTGGQYIEPTQANLEMKYAQGALPSMVISPGEPAFVTYNGHAELFTQSIQGQPAVPTIGIVEITVKWEFKGPSGQFLVPREPAPEVVA